MVMIIGKFCLYWHTLRHLKPIQFYGRIWFKIYHPKIKLTTEYLLRSASGYWKPPVAREPLMLEQGQFRFLNHTHKLPLQGGWNDAGLDKLWLYNLHYFDDLNAHDSAQRCAQHRSLLQRWIKENPPTNGNGWEPYPISLRMVNWFKWLVAGNVPVYGMLESLVFQANFLERRLEKHLLGNHLFANAKALVLAGLYFDGLQANKWLEKGLNIIENQLPEQILADGGNFERSTMYHAIFLEDMLDLINASEHWRGCVHESKINFWHVVAKRMLVWLTGMTHPDGEIGLFNDAAFSIAPKLSALIAYANRLGISNYFSVESDQALPRIIHFAESGYIRMETDGAVALLDVAPLGPDYLPGHAHADTLSFELSLFGQRVVVNGGTSCYGNGSERLWDRGTAAHSTVQIGGQNSSEVWGGFRVARRAYPFDLQTLVELGELHVACSHDGYKRLTGRPVHRREWKMTPGSLMVTDQVKGGEQTAVARYILHPSVKVIKIAYNEWLLKLAGGEVVMIKVSTGKAEFEETKYAPEFGKILKTKSLVVHLIDGFADIQFKWH
jgi:uncharacterized heparinase superfamily protein